MAPREQRSRAMFFALIGRHLDNLYQFVRHRLSYSEAVGDLLPRELTPEDVVDAVLLRAYREFVKSPPAGKIRSWLIGLAREEVAAQIARHHVRGGLLCRYASPPTNRGTSRPTSSSCRSSASRRSRKRRSAWFPTRARAWR